MEFLRSHFLRFGVHRKGREVHLLPWFAGSVWLVGRDPLPAVSPLSADWEVPSLVPTTDGRGRMGGVGVEGMENTQEGMRAIWENNIKLLLFLSLPPSRRSLSRFGSI